MVVLVLYLLALELKLLLNKQKTQPIRTLNLKRMIKKTEIENLWSVTSLVQGFRHSLEQVACMCGCPRGRTVPPSYTPRVRVPFLQRRHGGGRRLRPRCLDRTGWRMRAQQGGPLRESDAEGKGMRARRTLRLPVQRIEH